jgi:TonB family protein
VDSRSERTGSGRCRSSREMPLVAVFATATLLALLIRPVFCKAESPPRPSFTQEKTAPTGEQASLLQKAEGGDARSQFELGVRYEYGLGVPRDYARASGWYAKAAEQGLADAQNNLGVMYSLGQGVPQDYAQAVAWWTKAAEQGLAKAMHNLGEMYHFGRGVPVDSVESLKWIGLEEAGAAGDQKTELAGPLTALAGSMTPDEVAEAQRRAREWADRHARMGASVGSTDLSALLALKGGLADGVSLPRLLHEVKPNYTAAAVNAKIQGIVLLDCVVGIDGRVIRCAVVRSLDARFGLDQKAIEAALQWRFLPGKKDGQPVPVTVTIELTFSLRGK